MTIISAYHRSHTGTPVTDRHNKPDSGPWATSRIGIGHTRQPVASSGAVQNGTRQRRVNLQNQGICHNIASPTFHPAPTEERPTRSAAFDERGCDSVRQYLGINVQMAVTPENERMAHKALCQATLGLLELPLASIAHLPTADNRSACVYRPNAKPRPGDGVSQIFGICVCAETP